MKPSLKTIALLLPMLSGQVPEARTIVVATAADLKSKTAGLVAGDTLLAEPGNYDVTTWSIANLKGTAASPIVIRARTKAAVRSTSNCCNLVEMANLEYVEFKGFELTMAAANDGIDGIKLSGKYTHHLTMEDLHIHHMTNNGISLYPDSCAFVTLRNSEISHTSGSGLYWGYPNRNIVRDALIQGNYIHDCPANAAQDTHYGIQFKGWGYRSRILDNVLHDVGGTSRSGIIVYYGKKPLAGDEVGDINIVSGNVVWNARAEGITVMSDALIENNIVFDAGTGINLQTYNDESYTGQNAVENLFVRNNTVFRCRSAAMSVSGWANALQNVFLSGNAIYQETAGKSALTGSLGKGVARGNVVFGASSIAGTKAGKGLSDFAAVTAAGMPPALDFHPAAGSALLDLLTQGTGGPDLGGDAALDFDGNPRLTPSDAGAYERLGAVVPGWVIKPGFRTGSSSSTGISPARRGSKARGASGAKPWPTPTYSRPHSGTAPAAAGAADDPHAPVDPRGREVPAKGTETR